jgi:hypothetical protein
MCYVRAALRQTPRPLLNGRCYLRTPTSKWAYITHFCVNAFSTSRITTELLQNVLYEVYMCWFSCAGAVVYIDVLLREDASGRVALVLTLNSSRLTNFLCLYCSRYVPHNATLDAREIESISYLIEHNTEKIIMLIWVFYDRYSSHTFFALYRR